MATKEDSGVDFHDINADQDVDNVSVIESLCMACEQNGITRLLLTKIPYFREVIIMAFECPHCGFRNNEIQPGGALADKACRYELHVDASSQDEKAKETRHTDLNRQIVKSDTASVKIPEIEFEIPRSKRGEISTIEGILTVAADTLQQGQEERVLGPTNVFEKVEEVIHALKAMAAGERSFTFILEDIGGNSYIENPFAPEKDPRAKVLKWVRSHAEIEDLGYSVENEDPNAFPSDPGFKSSYKVGGLIGQAQNIEVDKSMEEKAQSYFDVLEKSAFIPGDCPSCHRDAETRMCVTDVPYFKEIIIMATQCDHCGYKNTEVKPGGHVSEKGRRVTLKVLGPQDKGRDLLKSDSAGLNIPELDLHLDEGTLGGKYTTVEGLMTNLRDEMKKINAFGLGDSAQAHNKGRVQDFFEKLDKMVSFEMPFTLVLDDPLGNIFIYGEPNDPQVVVDDYERTFEQNEELGLNDMNVDNYQTEEQLASIAEHPATEDQPAEGTEPSAGSSSSTAEHNTKSE